MRDKDLGFVTVGFTVDGLEFTGWDVGFTGHGV